MAEGVPHRFDGKRVLIVEDEYMIARDLALALEDAGAEVVGPAGTIQDALELIEDNDGIDGAVLDVNLHGERIYPVADLLSQKESRLYLRQATARLVCPLSTQTCHVAKSR
jgi:DNA-binding response OmpR family regulator